MGLDKIVARSVELFVDVCAEPAEPLGYIDPEQVEERLELIRTELENEIEAVEDRGQSTENDVCTRTVPVHLLVFPNTLHDNDGDEGINSTIFKQRKSNRKHFGTML